MGNFFKWAFLATLTIALILMIVAFSLPYIRKAIQYFRWG